MLIRYKKVYEKIAMGLLSYMPGGLTVKDLQDSIQVYETDDSWQLFLWKKEEDFIGLIGLEDIDETTYIIHHITVNPSFRGEGIGEEILKQLQQQLPEREWRSSPETNSFLQRFILKKEGAD